jgi:hypothetical protein
MKLKKLMKEEVSSEYVDDFHKHMVDKYNGKKINGWKFYFDRMSGTFYWDSPQSKNTIMATPFWDSNDGLPVDVMDKDSGEEVLSTQLPLKSTGDIKKDEINYLKLLKTVFQKIK